MLLIDITIIYCFVIFVPCFIFCADIHIMIHILHFNVSLMNLPQFLEESALDFCIFISTPYYFINNCIVQVHYRLECWVEFSRCCVRLQDVFFGILPYTIHSMWLIKVYLLLGFPRIKGKFISYFY